MNAQTEAVSEALAGLRSLRQQAHSVTLLARTGTVGPHDTVLIAESCEEMINRNADVMETLVFALWGATEQSGVKLRP